jgi:hypothetical protein
MATGRPTDPVATEKDVSETEPDCQGGTGRVLADAQKATDGLPMFTARILQGWRRSDIGAAGLLKPSALVAKVEALGWRLDQMFWTSRNDWYWAEGFFLKSSHMENARGVHAGDIRNECAT